MKKTAQSYLENNHKKIMDYVVECDGSCSAFSCIIYTCTSCAVAE